MNIAVFSVGLMIMLAGLFAGLISKQWATQLAGLVAGIGGFVGVIYYLIEDPLNRVQNAMTNLVQIETAFTSFIWELNLNGTYIQSQYVAKGKLTDEEIARRMERMEGAMNLTLGMLGMYTKEGGQRILTRLTTVAPAAAQLGSWIKLHGQHLQGDMNQKTKSEGVIAINHVPVNMI